MGTMRWKLWWLQLQVGAAWFAEALTHEPIYRPAWALTHNRGRKIIKREFTFCGETVEMAGRIQWNVAEISVDWHREFFSFGWLQDVVAIHSEKIASSFAREFINGFTLITPHDNLHPSAWEPEVAGERLAHWLYYRAFVLRGGSRTFFVRYERALLRHIQMLYQLGCATPEALSPNALKGLLAAATALPSLLGLLQPLLRWLEMLIQRDILPDGGHISLSPHHHVQFLRTLIEMKEMLETISIAFEPLDQAIARMGAFLRMIIHGDGKLGLFQQNLMDDPTLIAQCLQQAGIDTTSTLPKAHMAESSGYARIHGAHQSLLLARILPSTQQDVPAGVGSIEYSVAKERLIVNCGTYVGTSSSWIHAMQQPSAFSALSSTDDALDKHTPDNASQTLKSHDSHTTLQLLLPLAHGVTHERQLDVYHHERMMRGKDMLHWSQAEHLATNGLDVAVRFHLHPDVRCQPRKEHGILLTLVSGQEWLFTTSAATFLHVEESVFLGVQGKPQKTLQLCIAWRATEERSGISWELRHVAAP
ncbi:MAG: hypothetical protein EAY65_02690 [Alphaproteobacteria bacterium]|nr:MAG: hypothetical protein EAY65_02690 [Alphaproteobacteria bacterium]